MSLKLNQRNVFKLEALVISVVAAATAAVGVDQFVAVVAIIADVTAVSTILYHS